MHSELVSVGEWLRGIGLERYEAVFREHGIDSDLLPDLTEDDLKQLGVAFGSRKRLMSVIAERARAAQAEAGSASVAARVPAVKRRPVTILFCEFEQSKAAGDLDIEDWREIVGAYRDAAAAVVAKFGGELLPELDDTLMVVFGYRQSQENDAERAVRAALAIQDAVAERNVLEVEAGRATRSVRIGIESGNVVIDSTGKVFGKAPNIAARVRAAAELGQVLVTANVQRQVAGLFIAEDRGDHTLKGVPHSIHLYRIVRLVSAEGGPLRRG